MKKSILSLLLCLIGIAGAQTIQAAEIYATLVNGQFTLYYDNQKTTRSNVVAEWTKTSGTQNLSETIKDAVTSIVLDPSMQVARPTSTVFWFFKFVNATQITGLEYLNTSEVTEMYRMFLSCSSLTTLDVSGFDTRNVTDMSYMFSNCESLTTLDVSGFDTRNVTDMSCMFLHCESLTTLDVSGFDTRNVTNMGDMFDNCYALTTLDVSGFDTRNVTNMESLFFKCSSLTTLDVSGFDTKNVTTMGSMFLSCSSLTTLDVSGFNTQNVTDMSYMFYGCKALTTIYGDDDWSPNAALQHSGNMFYGSEALVGGNGTTYDENHTDITYARPDEEGTPGYFTKKPEVYATRVDNQLTLYCDLQKDTRSNVLTQWTEKDGANWFDAWTSIQTQITSIVLDESMKNARPTSTKYWFYNFWNVTQITGLNYLNTSNVTDMSYMFSVCEKLTTLDLSGFDTRNVKDMSHMFSFSKALTTLDLSGWDTQKVTNMSVMFKNCLSLTTLDLSGWDTQNVTNMEDMFSFCTVLTTIYCNDDWSQNAALQHSDCMFLDCTALVGENGTAYDENHIDATYARPDEDGIPGYFTKKSKTAIDNVSADKTQSTKFFRDGMLIIRHGEKEYNAQGQMMK